MGDEIARYREVRPDGRRLFTLYADRILVQVQSGRVRSELTVRLVDVRPEPNKLWVRPKAFAGGILLLVASVGTLIAAESFRRAGHHAEDGLIIWFSSAFAFAFVGLVVVFKTIWRIEFTQFVSRIGTAILDVARAGPDASQFDEFVGSLIHQIHRCQTTHPDPPRGTKDAASWFGGP